MLKSKNLADYSHAGTLKSVYINWKIRIPNVKWDYSWQTPYEPANIEFSGRYINGKDPYANENKGSATLNLLNGEMEFHPDNQAEMDLHWWLGSVFYYGDVKRRYEGLRVYYDLDGDGHEDIYETNTDEGGYLIGVCDTRNLTGLYTLSLAGDYLKNA